MAKGLHLILDQPESARIHCALDGGTIVGMVSVLFTASTAEGGRSALLEDMVVHPDWRGLEIGGKLLNLAVQDARAAGCVRDEKCHDLMLSVCVQGIETIEFRP